MLNMQPLTIYDGPAQLDVHGAWFLVLLNLCGLFERDHTTLYVSRGLGFEGGATPRGRFFCRPEIVSLELGGTNEKGP